MKIEQVLQQLDAAGIYPFVEDGKLKTKAKSHKLSPELVNLIKLNKDKLIELLSPATKTQPISAEPRSAQTPLSYAQKRLWFMAQMDPNSDQYNISAALHLSGRLDVARLERAIDGVVQRHEILRTCYVQVAGEPFQQLLHGACFVLELGQQDDRASELIAQFVARPFDLSRDFMLRGLLLSNADDHVLAISVHHIASDGWSIGILLKEIECLYRNDGDGSALEPLKIQYSDYASWQQSDQYRSRHDKQKQYWLKQLEELPQKHNLPLDHSRPPHQSVAGNAWQHRWSPALTTALKALAKAEGVSLFVLLNTLVNILISRSSNEQDVVIGTPVSGRNHYQIEPLVGCFVNTLVLRSRVDGDLSFCEQLAANRDMVLDAFEYQDYPFDQLVDDLNIERSTAYPPVFQILFSYLDFPPTAVNFPDVAVARYDTGYHTAKYDLELTIHVIDDELLVDWLYADALFEEQTIVNLAHALECLARSAVANPRSKVNQLILVEQDLSLHGPSIEIAEDDSVIGMFEKAAFKYPNRVALTADEGQLTYAELNTRANAIAARLAAAGLQRGDVAAVCLPRDVDVIVALLAVQKCGCGYVPLDPVHSSERFSYIVGDAQPKLLIYNQNTASLVEDFDCSLLNIDEAGEAVVGWQSTLPVATDLMYMLYTSGSTGSPKGVLVDNRGVVSLLKWGAGLYSREEIALVLASSSLNFDVSVFELYLPLVTGNTLLLVNNILSLVDDPSLQPTLINSVPSLIQALLETGKIPASVRTVNMAGEPLPGSIVNSLFADTNTTRVINLYGPTETTIYSSYYEMQAPVYWEPPIGLPVANTCLLVLDEGRRSVPQGMAGQLYIGGVGLARGYHNLLSQTAKSFIEHQGERLYATGDLVRVANDGNICYLGRVDQQVKLRGFRVEIGDIEANLRRIEGVANAVVLLQGNAQRKLLRAYVEAKPGALLDKQAISTELGRRLPDYMVPEEIRMLDSLPLNASGKTDRKALAQLRYDPVEVVAEAPTTDTELALTEVWADLLGLRHQQIGKNSNFFTLGGNSLMVVKLIYELEQRLGKTLTVKAAFDNQALAAMAAILDNEVKTTDFSVIEPRPLAMDAPVPLSKAQQRIWMVDHLSDGKAYYNIFASVTIVGSFDVTVARKAFAALVERHHVLRTCYQLTNGEPSQLIISDAPDMLTYTDLRSDPEQLDGLLAEQADVRFNLTRDIPVKLTLMQISAERFVLAFNVHHIAADGGSIPVMVGEFFECYQQLENAGVIQLPTPSLQYADYAFWQTHHRNDQAEVAQLEYWKQQLAGMPQVHQLPLSFSRPEQQMFSAGHRVVNLNEQQVKRLEALAKANQCTLFMVLHALFVVTLARYSASQDIVLGTASANRRRAELKSMVGCFVNTLVLRNQYNGTQSFEDLLGAVREVNIDAQDNQDIAFEQLVEVMQPQRTSSYSPLVQVFFNMDNNEQACLTLPDFKVIQNVQDITSSKFDLSLTASREENGLQLRFVYQNALFNDTFIRQLSESYVHLADVLSELPKRPMYEISLLNDNAYDQIVDQFNCTEVEYDKQTSLIVAFEAAVKRTPNKVAFYHNGEAISYSDLDARANALANGLHDASVRAGDIIPVMVKAAFEVPLYFLAIWKASAVIAPLDVDWPQERLREVLNTLEAKVVLTNLPQLAENLADVPGMRLQQYVDTGHATHRPELQWQLDDPIYIFHTSGSTGKPKGAVNVQRGLLNRFYFTQKAYNIAADDVFIVTSNTCFDPILLQTILPLLFNAQAVLPQAEERFDVPRLIALSETHQVNFITFTPTLFNHLVEYLESGDEHVEKMASIREISIGGESINGSDILRFRALGLNTKITNWYGPTETTIGVIRKPIDLNRLDVIGRPIANVRTYILDSHQQPVPVGVSGELYLAGDCLGQGYWRLPEQTAKAFPTITIGGRQERVYRTGDLVTYLEDGDIRFIGRKDDQIKIRGLRVELDEVIARLRECPEVDGATVLVEGDGQDKTLVGYLVLSGVLSQDKETVASRLTSLRCRLAAILPAYMLPSRYAVMDSLPMTLNQKIDKEALRKVPLFEFDVKSELDSDFARTASVIWQSLLRIETVSCSDNFFSLGGNSLLCIKLRDQMSRQGYEFSLQQLLAFPTIAEQQVLLDQGITISISPTLRLNSNKQGSPLFMIHPMGGGVREPYHALAEELADTCPVFGLQAPFLAGVNQPFNDWTVLSDYYVDAILSEQAQGPYRIGAFSGGGRIAVGVIQRLLDLGNCVSLCLMFDSYPYFGTQEPNREAATRAFITSITDGLVDLTTLPVSEAAATLDDKAFYQELAIWLGQNVKLDQSFLGNLADGLAFNIQLRQLPPPRVKGFKGKLCGWFSSHKNDPKLIPADWEDVFDCTIEENWLDASHLEFLERKNVIKILDCLCYRLKKGEL